MNPEERLVQLTRLVDRDRQQWDVADVAKAVRRVRGHDEHLIWVHLDDRLSGGPASCPSAGP